MILLDLFSGIGGFHYGLEAAGFRFDKVYFSEIDKYAIANYQYHYETAQHIGSVEHILNAGIERPNIITFGSPCQDFSLAGKRRGLSGKRSSLIEYALSAISHFRPDIFVWENVKGAFSSNNSEDFWAIIQAFANIGGYNIEWQLLNTLWVLPQNRERIYLVGYLADQCRGEIFPIEEETVLDNKPSKSTKKQVASCLQSMKDTNVANGEYKGMNLILQRPRGNNKGGLFSESPCISANSFEHNNHIISYSRDKKGKVLNYHKKNTANIIHSKTGGGGNTSQFVLQDNIRRLTEIECERLQGFSDNWTRYGNFNGEVKEISGTQRYKLIGNAVTTKIVELVGRRILK